MSVSLKKNTILNIVKSVSAILFPIITSPYVCRTLGVDNVGKISFSGSFISYFVLVANLGVGVYAIRECAKFRDDRSELSLLSSEIYTLNLLSTLLSFVLLTISLVTLKSVYSYRLLIIIYSFPILFSILGTDWINISMEDIQYVTIRTVLFQIISLVLLFAFVKKPEDYYKYAIISVISSSGANILNIFYRKRFCDIKIILTKRIFRHLKPVLFLFVMSITQTMLNNIDSTMLGFMKGDTEVGIYYTAHRVSGIISQSIYSITLVVMPRISFLYFGENFNDINKLLRKVFGFIMSLGIPAILGTYFLSNDIIMFIAGKQFLDSIEVLKILVFSIFFTFIGFVFVGNIILLPMNQEKYYMCVSILASVLNVILNYIFIPRFSFIGTAYSTLICSIISFAVLYIKIDKRIKLNDYVSILYKPLVGCIVIYVVCNTFRMVNSLYYRLFFSILVSVPAYFISQVLLNNELCISFFKTIIGKIKFIKN